MNPGTWQQYVQRPDNRGLSIALLERKYIQEQHQFQMMLMESAAAAAAASSAGGGGGNTAQASVVITDTDVLAFVAASGITDNTQKSAVNTLVTSLKGYSVWSSLNAIYPFVGGTASTHKWNLKDPRDLDAAYRLSFSGGWTHNSNGITGNASNTYADTFFFNATTQVRAMGVYTRNTTATSLGAYIGHTEQWDTTDPEGTTVYADLIINDSQGGMNFGAGAGRTTFLSNTNKSGFYGISSGSASQIAVYKNGALNNTVSVNPGVGTWSAVRSLKIGAQSNITSTDGIFNAGSDTITNYTNQNLAFVFIAGQYLTAAQMGNIYTAVQAYQTTLGRQV